ncbi:MAG: FAD-binding protein, partial [Thermoleophilia bacterium]|nr:FAD-binding protein [Thermoleophilia bacterium]
MNLPTFVGAKLAARLRRIPGVKVWVKAPLAPFTTIGTGGSAELLVSVGSTQALTAVLRELQTDGVPWICLGVGSNVLVADRGYAGVVIKLDENFHYVEGLTPLHPHDDSRSSGTEGNKVREEPVCLVVGAGAFLARLAAVAAEAGLSGLEFACGIPGSVGGAVVMNAGAHGRAFADVVEAVELTSAVGPTW